MNPSEMSAAWERVQALAKAVKYGAHPDYELRVGKNGRKRWMRKEGPARGQSSPPGRKAKGARMGTKIEWESPVGTQHATTAEAVNELLEGWRPEDGDPPVKDIISSARWLDGAPAHFLREVAEGIRKDPRYVAARHARD